MADINDFGFKVVTSGADITTTDVRNILLSSTYLMLKYSAEYTDSETITAGNTSGSVTFNHGLSYVPVFITYVEDEGDLSGDQRLLPYGIAGNPVIITSYATTTQIVNRIDQISLLVDRTYNFRTIVFKDKIV